jgi:hypothetical protein
MRSFARNSASWTKPNMNPANKTEIALPVARKMMGMSYDRKKNQ